MRKAASSTTVTAATSSRSTNSSKDSLKRKSGEFLDENNENVNNGNILQNDDNGQKSTSIKGVKKMKVETVDSDNVANSSTATAKARSGLPRYQATRAKQAANQSQPQSANSPPRIRRISIGKPLATPLRRKSVLATPAATPSVNNNSSAHTTISGDTSYFSKNSIAELLPEATGSYLRGQFESNTLMVNDRLNSIMQGLKVKSKWDAKEKMKKQETVIKDLKEFVVAINDQLLTVKESCITFEGKVCTAMVEASQVMQKQSKALIILENREKELNRQLEALNQELERSKGDVAKQRADYQERAHKLELRSITYENDIDNKNKEIATLTSEIMTLKAEKDNQLSTANVAFEKKMMQLQAKNDADCEQMKKLSEQREIDNKRLVDEKEDHLQKIRSLTEQVMKLEVSLSSADTLHGRKDEELEKGSAEIQRLKDMIAKKDEDLMNTMTSLCDIQRKAQEEKNAIWTEFSTVNAKFQQCEDERRQLFSQLAEKREEVALLQRDLTQVTTQKQDLDEKLASKESEIESSRDLQVQLEIEKKLRMKCEVHEENERRERTAAVAQLMAIQSECTRKLQDNEEKFKALEKSLNDSLQVMKDDKEELLHEKKVQADSILGLQTEIENLHHALKNASANHESVELLSKTSGEVEVLRNRLKQAAENKEVLVGEHLNKIKELADKLTVSENQRRKLHNLVQELRGNVRVFARVRPFLPSDGIDINNPPVQQVMATRPDLNNMVIRNTNANATNVDGSAKQADEYSFNFDKVFAQSTSQEVIFEEVAEFVQSALDGYNVCLFSYGQTGSGKTHTMNGSGNGSMRGIIPRAMEQVANYRAEMQKKGWSYNMEVSFIEVYNETIRDLLRSDETAASANNDSKHEIKRDAQGNVFVSDVNKVTVDPSDEKAVAAIMETAMQHRSVTATLMNDRSSRSHAIFTLHLTAFNPQQGVQLNGALNLVDLAGSERLDRSGATGTALKETAAINKSLSSLADVFNALAKKQPHVPYRNSKLTHLLQPCLSGDGKTLMIVNLSPTEDSYFESLSSLRFASQVNQCELGKPKRKVKDVTATTYDPNTMDVSTSSSSTTSASAYSSTSSNPQSTATTPRKLAASMTKLEDVKDKSTSKTATSRLTATSSSSTRITPTATKSASAKIVRKL